MTPNDSTPRIILIDDEKRMCDSLSSLLTGDGYTVEAFQSSVEAAEAIKKGNLDLVITDIKMPKLDGIEILKIVKDVDREVPVILMTGFASLETALEAIARGAYDYLLKPVEFTDLELAVKRALDKRNSDRSQAQLLAQLKDSNQSLQQRIEELNALFEASQSIGSALHLSDLLEKLVSLAAQVTQAQVGSIMLLDDDRQHLTIEAAIGLDPEIVAITRLAIGESIAGHVARDGEPLVVRDVENDSRLKRLNKERYGAASLLCVPLKFQNEVIGVINMAKKKNGGVFTDNDLQLLATFASQAAVAVHDAAQIESNRRRLVEFEILHELATDLPQITSLNEFRSTLIDKMVRVFPLDFAYWFTVDNESARLVPEGASGRVDLPLTESGGLDLRKMNRESITFENVDLQRLGSDDIDKITAYIAHLFGKSERFPDTSHAFMCLPIKRHGEVAHVLALGANREEPYDIDDINLARLVVSNAAVLFEKEQSLLNATRLMTMGNMISEISHDLRKPLTSIRGGLQIIRKRWPELTSESEFFTMAEDEVYRMNELVRELVDFSNPNKYKTEKVDLRKVVTRASELIGPDLRKRQVTFESEFDDADWDLIINKNQILEALLNLFMNALDAMPDGGTLRVTGLIEQPDHKKHEYLALRITDSGHGIKREHLSRVFDRYYTTKETGTGLGLAVVERIISAHSGTLAVSSVEGKGTTFTLYFPIQ